MNDTLASHRGTCGTCVWLPAIVALLQSCGAAPPAKGERDLPAQILDTGAFRHEQHLTLELNGALVKCQDCHSLQQGSKFFETKRPGTDQHAPCDNCHKDAFYKPPGELCLSCHQSVDPFKKGNSPLKDFPRQNGRAQLISRFNHQTHIERNKERIKQGGEFACEACHQVPNKETAYATFPGHETCGPCHQEVAKPNISDCMGCHAQDGPTKGRHFLGNDIRFTHGKHRADSNGKRINCLVCHYAIPNSTEASEIVLPQMKDCAQCHASGDRTPERVRITECGVCHTSDVKSAPLPGNHTASLEDPGSRLQASGSRLSEYPIRKDRALWASGDGLPGIDAVLAPRKQLDISLFPTWDLSKGLPPFLIAATATIATSTPARSSIEHEGPRIPVRQTLLAQVRPEDHTPIFRKHHVVAARSADAKCSYCHEGLSGTTIDNCGECHAVMKPESHTTRWRSVLHGREAARDQSRCATCHQIDYCTECHSITPSSHQPIEVFRVRHNRSARVNPRACMTCHTFETTCSRCHGFNIDAGPVQPLPRALGRR